MAPLKGCRMGEQDQHDHRSQHYCRGCSRPLPLGTTALFHPDCLKGDKRERMREKRRCEGEKFVSWLRRLRCPECGAKLELMAKKGHPPNEKRSCEVSHDTPDQRTSHTPGESTQELLGADQPRILARSAAGTAKEAQGKHTPSKSHRNGVRLGGTKRKGTPA